MIHKFNRTQIEQSFSLTKLINIKTHFLEMSMCIYVCVKSSPKITFLNFSKSLLLDCHFNLPKLTPFCFHNLNLLFSVLLMLCFQKYSCQCSYFILDLLLGYNVTTAYISNKTKDFLVIPFILIISVVSLVAT